MSEISINIFNEQKSDYTKPALFLGEKPGLFDSINKFYPKIWALYKRLKKNDWDENDFNFLPCNMEFKTCSKSVYEIMIMGLAWQWQADSIAARSLMHITAPFVSSSELWAMLGRIADNEVIHAATYSEIVRSSFDYPEKILSEITQLNKKAKRSLAVSRVMEKTYQTSLLLSTGKVGRTQEVYNDIFMFFVAMYCLEGLQFQSSFFVTFAVGESGQFLPIAKAVQKIANEEQTIHAENDRLILDYELRTEMGLMAFNQCRPVIQNLLDEIVQVELDNADIMFSEGRELVGANAELLKQWVLFCAKPIYEFFGMRSKYELPQKNPAHFMESWLNIDAISISPQEERGGNYLVGGFVDDVQEAVFEVDF